MFPKNEIKIIHGGATSPREKKFTDEKTGIISTKMEECNKKLPDAEMFKIENQIKAGITLNEVNTNILTSDIPEKTAEMVTKSLSKSKTKTEKTNEVE